MACAIIPFSPCCHHGVMQDRHCRWGRILAQLSIYAHRSARSFGHNGWASVISTHHGRHRLEGSRNLGSGSVLTTRTPKHGALPSVVSHYITSVNAGNWPLVADCLSVDAEFWLLGVKKASGKRDIVDCVRNSLGLQEGHDRLIRTARVGG